jgi:alpha-tubulin suppressor-like RCC1 family protein
MRHPRSVVAVAVLLLLGLLGPVGATTGPAAAATVPAAPPPEGFLAAVAQVDAGDGHVCARMTSGQVRCWGRNFWGQIGDGTDDSRSLPTTVLAPNGAKPLTGVAQIDVGFHTCARLTNGQGLCWGGNEAGQLGNGTTNPSPLPRGVTLPSGLRLTGIAQIGAGLYFSCARLTSGHVRCWGDNAGGQIGDGTTTDRRRATLVTLPGGAPLTGVTQLSVGSEHACAKTTASQVRCWGTNNSGALGDGTTTSRGRARLVLNGPGTGPLGGVVQVMAGNGHTCFRVAGGQVRCVGQNGNGELGDGTQVNRRRPVVVRASAGAGPLTGVQLLGTSGGHQTCVRVQGPQVRCWGDNGDGRLGDGTVISRSRPVTVLDPTGTIPLGGVAHVSTGYHFTCARLSSGQARCWGNNDDGQLGDGTTTDRWLPVVVQL